MSHINKGTFQAYIDGQPISWGHVDSIALRGDPILAPTLQQIGQMKADDGQWPVRPVQEPISALGAIECSMTIEPYSVAAWEEFVVQSLTPGIDRTVVMKCQQGGGHLRLVRTLWALLEGRQPDRFWSFYLTWRGGCRLPRGMQRQARKGGRHGRTK